MDERIILDYLNKQYEGWKQHRKKNYESRWLESYRLYKGYRDNKLTEWQTNVFLNYAFTTIETVLPRIVEYLWRGDRLVTAFPRERSDEAQAKVVDFLIQYQIDTQMKNLFMEFVEFFKGTLIFGTGISKLTWDVDKDEPVFSSVDIFDFVVQPYKKYISEMEGVYHVYDRNVDYLLDRQRMGIGYKNVEQVLSESMRAVEEEGRRNKEHTVGRQIANAAERKTTLIHEYWGKVPVQDRIDVDAKVTTTRYEEKLVMIANKKHIIRISDNPYKNKYEGDGFKPFIRSVDYPDYGEFYGHGELDAIRDIQHEINETENQSLDNIKLIMNQMWKVSATAGVDYETLVSYPGGVVVADDIDAIQPLKSPDLPQSFFNKREQHLADIQSITGVTDYAKGANAPGMSDTVGGITALIEETNMRFGLKIRILQMTAIASFAEKLFLLDKMFIKDYQLPVRLQGQEGIEWLRINPDNLGGMYDFKPVGISLIGNKLARQNAYIRLVEVFSKMPPIPALAEALLDEYEVKNKAEVMTQLMQLWGMQQQQQQAQQQGGGQVSAPVQPGSAESVGNPQINDAQIQQQMGNLLAAGNR